VLGAWGKPSNANHEAADGINGAITALRTALATQASALDPIATLRPPMDTKQAQVLAMLTRDQGASGPQIAEAMGWAPHTVRGFLASLARKGIKVDVLEHVRQVGPNRGGTKSSFTVYHVANDSRQ
jgi:biotin operon repressor